MSNHSNHRRIAAHLQRIVMHRALAGQPTFRMTDRDLERQSADLAALSDRRSGGSSAPLH